MAAWQDFISSIEEERKKAGSWFGDRGRDIGNFANDTGKNVKNWLNSPAPSWMVDNDFYRGLDNFNDKVAEPTLNTASNFVTDTLQSIPRGVVNIGLSLDEMSRDTEIDQRNKTIDDILAMKKEDRDALLKKWDSKDRDKTMTDEEWGKAFALDRARKQLGGSLDDDKLKARKEENLKEKGTHKTYKADNDVAKFFLGGEDDEVAQSAQKTNEDIKNWGTEQGLDSGQSSALGFVGAVGLTALDAPTGLGSLAKSPLKALGKQGIKSLAKETTEAGVTSVIKKAIPNVTESALKELAPKLAKETDEKVIKSLIRSSSESLIPGVRGGLGSAKDSAKEFTRNLIKRPGQAVDDVAQPLVDDLAESGIDLTKNAVTTPPVKPGQYGEAADKMLGSFKTSSELQDAAKAGRTSEFKTQMLDKLSPINEFVGEVETRLGRKLSTEDNPYELMRLFNGMPDQVQQRVQGLTDILKTAPDLDAVKIIGIGRQIRGRSERGVKSFMNSDEASQAIKEVYGRLGPEGFDKAARVVDTVNDYNKQLLKELNANGIISDDALRAIEDVGADYFSRFNVVEYIMKNSDNQAMFSRTGSYNTTKQSLNKILASAKGMEEGTEILDPIESIVRSTDKTMRAIAKNDIWKAFDRLADEVPDLVVRTRDPENVVERIALSLDNKELRPIRNKLDRMISTRGSWVKRLESQVNQLNKKGMNVSLKNGGERMTSKDFLVGGLGGNVPTSQVGKVAGTAKRVGDETVQGFMDVVNPQKLGTKDTGAFVRNLIEKGSRSDIDKIKKMIGTRDVKLTQLIDDIGEMKSQYDDVAGAVRTNSEKIKGLADEAAPEGMELISGFGKGVQGKLAVPKEIAEVFTGKTKAQQDYLTGMMGTVNGFIKQNLTANNPVFALITNPIRDAKTFAYNTKTTSSNPFHIGYALTKGVADAITGRMGKSELYDRWVAAGGRSGFYADERSAERMATDLARTVSGKKVLGVKVAPVHSAKDFVREATRVLSAPIRVPFEGLRGAAGILEDAPRLAEFRGAVKKEMTDKQAAFLSRNVTVDFQQAGRVGQVVNAWVPFLNARLQGTLKTVGAVKSNPARAASVYATLTAAPIMLSAYNNYVRFPEVTKMIGEEERQNNFIIVLGDDQDEAGNYTQVLKIPKSDVDKVLGNPLEQFARFIADDDPQNMAEILTNMVGSVTPVDIVRDNKFSAERAASGLLPAPLKIPLESAANRSFYFGSDLVSQGKEDLPANMQVNDSTTGAAKFIGAISGGSPIKIDNTLGNLGLRTGAKILDNPTEPFASKLTGSTGNRMNDEFYSIMDEVTPNRKKADVFINEALAKGDYAAARETAENYNAYLLKKFSPLNSRYSDQITKDMIEQYTEKKINLNNRSIKQRQRNALEKQAAGK